MLGRAEQGVGGDQQGVEGETLEGSIGGESVKDSGMTGEMEGKGHG